MLLNLCNLLVGGRSWNTWLTRLPSVPKTSHFAQMAVLQASGPEVSGKLGRVLEMTTSVIQDEHFDGVRPVKASRWRTRISTLMLRASKLREPRSTAQDHER